MKEIKSVLKRASKAVGVYPHVASLMNRYRYVTTPSKRILEQRLIPEKPLKEKLAEAVKALNLPNERRVGDYLEFGVYNGGSLAAMYHVAGQFGLDGMRLFGFDSFRGLPKEAWKDDDGLWAPGAFRCGVELARINLARSGVDRNRVFLVEGWFKDTLNDQTKQKYAIEKASIIMVDCESYSSTTECLNFIEPMILKEAIVMFADWKGWNGRNLHEKNLGEKRAFTELLERHQDIEVAADLGSFSLESQVFHVRRRLSDRR